MADDKGYYVFWDYPKELKTDQQYTYKMSTTGGDMTGVTYEFKWEFTCNGVTTKETIASGLTSLTYTWTPTSVKFGPLMKKSKSGTLKLIVSTSTGKMTYSTELPLTISDSIKPSISSIAIVRTNGFNERSVSNITSHKLSFNVAGLYGATQSVTVEVGANKYTKSVDAVAGNKVTKVEFDIGTFDAGTSDIYVKSVWIQVADSRGNTTKTSTSIDIYKYTRPTVEASVYRNANEEAYIAFTPTTQTTVAGKANSIDTFYARTALDTTVVQTDLKTSPQKLNGADDITKSYNVFVLLKDTVGGVGVTRLVLPSNIPVMDIGSDGKTVSFFTTSPETATVESINICDSMHVMPDEILINAKAFEGSGTLIMRITSAGLSINDVIKLEVGNDGYSFTNASIRVACLESDNEWTGGDIVLNSDGSIQTGLVETNFLTCYGEVQMRSGATISGAPLYVNELIHGEGLSVYDSSSIIGVSLYRDGEGGQIVIYTPDTLKTWNIDAFNESLRFYYQDGTNGNYVNPVIFGKDNIVYTNNVKIYNNLNGNNATFDGNVYAMKYYGGFVYTNGFRIVNQWIDSNNHDLVYRSGNGYTSYFGPCNLTYSGGSKIQTETNIRGYTVRLYNHGGGTYLGSSGSTAITSDRNLKKDIYEINNKYVEFFKKLQPVSYKYNAKENIGHRDHLGYIAQDVEDALTASGLTTEQFAGICIENDVTLNFDDDISLTDEERKNNEIHYDKLYSLRYEEFIALNTYMIQLAYKKIESLESEINTLKQQ